MAPVASIDIPGAPQRRSETIRIPAMMAKRRAKNIRSKRIRLSCKRIRSCHHQEALRPTRDLLFDFLATPFNGLKPRQQISAQTLYEIGQNDFSLYENGHGHTAIIIRSQTPPIIV
jgi:hypothetical protein